MPEPFPGGGLEKAPEDQLSSRAPVAWQQVAVLTGSPGEGLLAVTVRVPEPPWPAFNHSLHSAPAVSCLLAGEMVQLHPVHGAAPGAQRAVGAQ